MSDFSSCGYCHGAVKVFGETRQGSVTLHGVGTFCTRSCARVYVTLHPSREPAFAPENVCGFHNPPLAFRVLAHRLGPDGVECVVISESIDISHAVRMASAYPSRAVVQDWHSRRVFDNGKTIPTAEAA